MPWLATGDGPPALDAEAVYAEALLLHSAGQYHAAAACCRQLLAADACHGEALHLLGVLEYRAGRHAHARALIERALAVYPQVAGYWFNLGAVAQALGALPRAAEAYGQALALQPADAVAAMNLGNVLQALGRLDAALERYSQALALRPHYAEACMNLANVLAAQGRGTEALAGYRQALTLQPGLAEARVNLGNLLQGLGRFAEAEAEYLHALQLRPGHAETLVNLGVVLEAQGRDKAAVARFQQAIAARPGCAEAHVNQALNLLRRGEFAAGLPGYEWRWSMAGFASPRRVFPQPQWRGEPLGGARILLHAEQGLGDCLQFLRYAPLVAAAAGSVVLEVPASLRRLVASLKMEMATFGEALPAFDWHCPLLSLPLAFGTTMDTIPASCFREPLVMRTGRRTGQPGARRVARRTIRPGGWRVRRLRIGVAWAGNALHPRDGQRSIPFELFAPLLAVPGVDFFSLQLGKPLTCLPANVVDLAPLTRDMVDTARQMAQLDLVICVDTAVAHLAGSLGCPVWILLAQHADWRWFKDRADSPWYPSARLFRQTGFQDWESVIDRVRQKLERWRDGANPLWR